MGKLQRPARPTRPTRKSVRMDPETAERLRLMARERGETRDKTIRVIIGSAWAAHQGSKESGGVRQGFKDWVAAKYEEHDGGAMTLKDIKDEHHKWTRVDLPMPVIERGMRELGAKSSSPGGGERVYHLRLRLPKRPPPPKKEES